MNVNHTADAVWQRPKANLSLPAGEVHVWRAELDRLELVERCYPTLADEEKERARRFHFKKDRDHFVIGRGALRAILAGYLKERPEGLSFGYGPYGKPYLVPEDRSDLRFNLSHSRGLALVAVTRGRELGIDVEGIRPEVMEEQLAERFFSPGEVAALQALPASQKADGFFNCWTRKEAYVKARGEGLSLPLDQFDVSLAPGVPAALLQVRLAASEANREVSRWTMLAIEPGAGFKAAVVVERSDWRLRCWQWPG